MQSTHSPNNRFRASLPWLVLAIVGLFIVLEAFLYVSSGSMDITMLRNPLVVALLVAYFLFLTLDRLREMNSRIDTISSSVASFWQQAFREVRAVARGEVETAIGKMQASATESFESLNARFESLVAENPWLRQADPNELALYSKHLEPVVASARALVRKGEVDTARRMVTQLINDPDVEGTPNDFHNVAVLAASKLNDDLLATQIHEIYLKRSEDPNPDVLADALEVYTRAENYGRARASAETIRQHLDDKDSKFTTRWRPWVFLAQYYLAVGRGHEAIEILRTGMDLVSDPRQRPDVIRNLGNVLQKLGKLDEAEAAFKMCLSEYPSHVPASLQLADLYWAKGDTAAAIDVLEKSISKGNLDPSHDDHAARAYVNLAKLSAAMGDRAASQTYASKAAAMGAKRDVADLLLASEDGYDPQQAFLAGASMVLKAASGVLPEEQSKMLTELVGKQLRGDEE